MDGFDAEITVDYRNFFERNTEYNKDLALLGSILADLVYVHDNGKVRRTTINPYKDLVKDTYIKGNDYGIKDVFTAFGLTDYEDYKLVDVDDYKDDDISEMMLGHRPISFNGETKEIVVVSIRGTDGTIEEWSSNFDVGSDYW